MGGSNAKNSLYNGQVDVSLVDLSVISSTAWQSCTVDGVTVSMSAGGGIFSYLFSQQASTGPVSPSTIFKRRRIDVG